MNHLRLWSVIGLSGYEGKKKRKGNTKGRVLLFIFLFAFSFLFEVFRLRGGTIFVPPSVLVWGLFFGYCPHQDLVSW